MTLLKNKVAAATAIFPPFAGKLHYLACQQRRRAEFCVLNTDVTGVF